MKYGRGDLLQGAGIDDMTRELQAVGVGASDRMTGKESNECRTTSKTR